MSTVKQARGSVLIFLLLFIATQSPASQASNTRNFSNFSSLRNYLSNLIGGAKKRVHLKTDILADGDIAQALIVAKYRKLNVHVSLSEQHIDAPLSYYNQLKQQSIPVIVTANKFLADEVSLLLIDNKLYKINSPLSASTSRQNYQVVATNRNQIPRILAGRDKPRHNNKSPSVAEPPAKRVASSGQKRGIYNYDTAKAPTSRPQGVANRLPTRPKFMLRESKSTSKSTQPKATYWDLNPIVVREPIFLNPKNRESR